MEDKGDEESCGGQRREGGRRRVPSCSRTCQDLTNPGGGLQGQGPGWQACSVEITRVICVAVTAGASA